MNINILLYFKAYAELEDDTPGQIHGITFKTDGKFKSSSTRAQGAETFANYTETDQSDTDEYKRNQVDGRFYFGLGVGISMILLFYLFVHQIPAYVEEEKQKTLREQELRRASAIIENKHPFGEA